MSGLDLLFENSVDYEKTHQLALYILFKKSDLARYLIPDLDEGYFCMDEEKRLKWEPEGRLFDLGVDTPSVKHYFEFKVWSPLRDNQLSRQSDFLDGTTTKGYYVLLGTSWFEHSEKEIQKKSSGKSFKIGYTELIKALEPVIANNNNPSDICELAKAYKQVLTSHQKKFNNGFITPNADKMIFYYSLYWHIQQLLGDMTTAIYTVNNGGGPAFILHNKNIREVVIDGITVWVYSEFENGKLRIKFEPDTEDNEIKRRIRESLRNAIHRELDNTLEIINNGRFGGHMTLVQVNHDFSFAESVEEAVKAFRSVDRALDRIIEGVNVL